MISGKLSEARSFLSWEIANHAAIPHTASKKPAINPQTRQPWRVSTSTRLRLRPIARSCERHISDPRQSRHLPTMPFLQHHQEPEYRILELRLVKYFPVLAYVVM